MKILTILSTQVCVSFQSPLIGNHANPPTCIDVTGLSDQQIKERLDIVALKIPFCLCVVSNTETKQVETFLYTHGVEEVQPLVIGMHTEIK